MPNYHDRRAILDRAPVREKRAVQTRAHRGRLRYRNYKRLRLRESGRGGQGHQEPARRAGKLPAPAIHKRVEEPTKRAAVGERDREPAGVKRGEEPDLLAE